jgi:hypothetical protein
MPYPSPSISEPPTIIPIRGSDSTRWSSTCGGAGRRGGAAWGRSSSSARVSAPTVASPKESELAKK